MVGNDRARVMMQLPTGGGKTVIAGALLKAWLAGGRRNAVWLTHRRELVEQTRKMLNASGVKTRIIEGDWPSAVLAPMLHGGVMILMTQTAITRINDAVREGFAGDIWGRYDDGDLMIIDEAHHAPAEGWARAMRRWPGPVVGMTATPWRLSEKDGFNHLFDRLICGPQVAELQELGALCYARVLMPDPQCRIAGGIVGDIRDYTEPGIHRANADRPDIMTAGALAFWQEHGSGRPTIAYAVSVKHAYNLAAVFKDAKTPAEVILGETKPADRDGVVSGFRNGRIKVLVNVQVATEGVDLPDASCIIITRPTMSLALHLQMMGRGLRPKADGGDCLILDLTGNSERHGKPEKYRNWSLRPRGVVPTGATPAVECPLCGKRCPAATRQCPQCGHQFGKECNRCGRWRAWTRWEYEAWCRSRHDKVCDLCHWDAHIHAHLPTNSLPDALILEHFELPLNSDLPVKDLPHQDLDALFALYRTTEGANWKKNTNWWSGVHLREWYGVATDTYGNVTNLELEDNNLNGEIPAELSNLSNLKVLALGSNQLAGEIPVELSNLSSLRVLALDSNQLTGRIPAELGNLNNLEWLWLNENQLTGDIPTELGSLANLEWLLLNDNQLMGKVPSDLGNLAHLEILGIEGNELTGKIPAELCNLVNLHELRLSDNRLTGRIPAKLGNITNLKELSLSGNQLRDRIPAKLGELGNLHELRLNDNRLTGKIPVKLCNLSNLKELYLHSNQLTGDIPSELGNLSNLKELFLHSNQLTSDVPVGLGNLTNLERIKLCNNRLTGSIPVTLGNLTNLEWLVLHTNQLTGEIPAELSNLANLKLLLLSRNQLSGCIPSALRDVRSNDLGHLNLPFRSDLVALVKLYSATNTAIEASWARDDKWLSDAPLSEWYGVTTDAGGNVTALKLPNNQLTGMIPAELGNLAKLKDLRLSRNNLVGEIPPELGNLANLNNLRLSGNQLTGCIPSALRDVSHNDLYALGLPFCDE